MASVVSRHLHNNLSRTAHNYSFTMLSRYPERNVHAGHAPTHAKKILSTLHAHLEKVWRRIVFGGDASATLTLNGGSMPLKPYAHNRRISSIRTGEPGPRSSIRGVSVRCSVSASIVLVNTYACVSGSMRKMARATIDVTSI